MHFAPADVTVQEDSSEPDPNSDTCHASRNRDSEKLRDRNSFCSKYKIWFGAFLPPSPKQEAIALQKLASGIAGS